MTTSARPTAASVCSNCGRVTNIAHPENKCPHCEQNTEAPIDPRTIDVILLTVALDLPCTDCGYNIKTLPIKSRCPECGTSISESIRFEALQFASLEWLNTVRSGVSMLLYVAISLPILVLPAVALASSLLSLFVFVIMLVASVLLLTGIVDVATMENEGDMTRRQRIPHRLSIAVVPLFFIPFISIPVALSESTIATIVLGGLFFASLVACYLSVAICLTRLARRGPRRTLARNTACVLWVVGLTILLASICLVVDATMLRSPPFIQNIFFTSIGIIFTVDCIAAAAILFQHRRTLTKAISTRRAMDTTLNSLAGIDDEETATHLGNIPIDPKLDHRSNESFHR